MLGNDRADIGDLKNFIHQRMKVFLRDQSLLHDLIDEYYDYDCKDKNTCSLIIVTSSINDTNINEELLGARLIQE